MDKNTSKKNFKHLPICIIMNAMVDYLQKAKFFRTKKRLGQNFLINSDVIDSIIDYAKISKDDIVLEIGPGVGFLTEQLVKHAKKVIAVELDKEAIVELKKIECDNLEIIHNDILKVSLNELVKGSKVRVIANIPYYITSPILIHLLGEIDDLSNQNRDTIEDIILMVQEEVARRIVATENSISKQYGLLTILAQFWAECSIIRLVGRKSFYPAPKVNSALVSLKVRKEPLLKLSNYSFFRRVVKSAFAHRRKTLKNCLLASGFDKGKVNGVFAKMGIREDIRGEKLSIMKFGELSEFLL